jgi:hypothetical protein
LESKNKYIKRTINYFREHKSICSLFPRYQQHVILLLIQLIIAFNKENFFLIIKISATQAGILQPGLRKKALTYSNLVDPDFLNTDRMG